MKPFNNGLKLLLSLGVGFLTLASGQATFRAIPLPDDGERVTGIYCAQAKACVVSTDKPGGPGHIYATDGQKITATIITGDAKFAEPLGTLGEVGFLGFNKVGDQLVALVGGAGAAWVTATGDPTQPASWKAVKIGSPGAGNTFGLNQQMGIGTKDGRWLHFTFRNIYESNDAPGPGALWDAVWSPVSPSIPKNFADLKKADPKLCDSDPGTSISPRLIQPAYVAPDLSVVLYPSGARNQRGSGVPGVCISTDGGKRFYVVEFKGIESEVGPMGFFCAGTKCLAYGGLDSAPTSSVIFFSNDAQKGVNSAWAPAKLPNLREDTKFRGIFLDSSGNGWAVGWDTSSPLLFGTTDGGATWKDFSSTVRSLASGGRLHSVYAFDPSHIWIGGERGVLLTSGN